MSRATNWKRKEEISSDLKVLAVERRAREDIILFKQYKCDIFPTKNLQISYIEVHILARQNLAITPSERKPRDKKNSIWKIDLDS